MSCLNYHLINAIPSYYREALGYYPDMLVYQHNAVQYKTDWEKLIAAKYLYTNGYEVKTTGFLRYSFESFKGWFGFNNHCEQGKVKLALCKFAYYGYLQNYSQTCLQKQLTFCNLPQEYLINVQKPRTATTSKVLQNLLIKYYHKHANLLPQSFDISINAHYSFGNCFKLIDQWAEIPRLDPQSPALITNTINKLEYDLNIKNYPFFVHSYYAELAALSYLDKARAERNSYLYQWSWFSNAQSRANTYLKRALSFNPNIIKQDLVIYIDYFLAQQKLDSAFSLITQLSDLKQAMGYLTQYFKTAEQLSLVNANPTLAKALAHYYAQKNDLDSLRIAMQLDDALEQSSPTKVFTVLITDKEYEKAYNLWLKNQDKFTFCAKDLAVLANYFNALGEQAYNAGQGHRKKSQWEEASVAYQQSWEAKSRAFKIEPNKNRQAQYSIHQRLYAQLLIDADLKSHKPAQSNINNIEQAIKLLDTCVLTVVDADEQQRHRRVLIKGLMREVDYLTNLFSVPIAYNRDYETRKQHNKKHQANFELAINNLHRITNLLKNTTNIKQKKSLGKAYYLLGDVASFFNLNSYNPIYFKKAMETVPTNPFYLLRCSELFLERQDELREKAVPLLKEQGFTTDDYLSWDEERWDKDEHYKKSPIKDIHHLDIKERALLSSFAYPLIKMASTSAELASHSYTHLKRDR